MDRFELAKGCVGGSRVKCLCLFVRMVRFCLIHLFATTILISSCRTNQMVDSRSMESDNHLGELYHLPHLVRSFLS